MYWPPPEGALQLAASRLQAPSTSAYGPCEGMPELIDALKQKLKVENGLEDVRTCVLTTTGTSESFPRMSKAKLSSGE